MFQPSPADSVPQPAPQETQVAREMRDIEQKLTALGAGPEEVKKAIMAHLGVPAPISLAGYGPRASERDRVRAAVQEQTGPFVATPDDPDDPVK